MLEIRVENEPIEIALGANIQFTSSSPIFDKDSIGRKFSLPFRLELTPNNKRLRKHSHRLDAANKKASRPSEVRFGGNLLLSGNMVQTSSSNEMEEVSISNVPLKIWENLGKIKINEILETFNLLDGRPAPLWKFTMGFTGTYTFVIPGTTASATAAAFPDIPAAGASIAAQLNAAQPGIANYNVGANLLEVDSFFLKDNDFGFTLFIVFSSEPIAFYHQNAVEAHILNVNTTPIESHCFPMIRWDNFYGDKNFLFTGLYGYHVINNVIDGTLLINRDITSTSGQLYWDNAIIPCVRIPYILQQIGEALGGYVWDGDVWIDTDFQKLIHVPNLALDEVTEEKYDDMEIHKRNTFKPEVNLNTMVPSMSAADFITQLCNTFCLYLDSADGVLSFKKKQTPMQVQPINLDGRIGKDVPVDPSSIDGWKLAMAVNPNELYADATELNSVISGGGEYEIATANSLFMDDSHQTSPFNFARMPVTNQPGRSPAFDTGANKSTMPLCLLFCHELQPDSVGDNYLFASHDGLNYDGDTVGAYSLSPEGEFGLFENWWKGVIEYLVSDGLKVTAYLHAGEIQKLLEWQAGRISFYHPEGSVIAAVKSIQVAMNSQGVSATRLDLLF